MRTSNKILLGTFLAILFIITAIHAALYAKYKRNDFITMTNLRNERYDSYDLKDVQSVSLSGLENVSIIPADTARVEIEKNGYVNVKYEFANGVLTIKGDTTVARNDKETERVKSSRDVILYLPSVQHIKSDFCDLLINGKKENAAANSYDIELNETSLHFGGWNRDNDSVAMRFDKIDISKTKESSIVMWGSISMKQLHMNLETSSFEDSNLSCDSLFINTDSNSSVRLSGKNIPRTIFTSKQ